jgi:hypothetical protein
VFGISLENKRVVREVGKSTGCKILRGTKMKEPGRR